LNRFDFLSYAEQLKPTLLEKRVDPVAIVLLERDPRSFQGWKKTRAEGIDSLSEMTFEKGDQIVLDFGDHHVGYLTMSVRAIGGIADAPLRMKLTFGEVPSEIGESFDDYNGWLSKSWLQEEWITVDVLPTTLHMPRRYSFRYLKIEVIDTSRKYKVAISEIYCTAVTSGDNSNISTVNAISNELQDVDKVSIKTLQDCMQYVFEDGPKRDRRLWIGDLRLQALANYCTFNNQDLVKRCLFLFAGLAFEDGQIPACVYEYPSPVADDIRLFDYSLFFTAILYDYYKHTNDMDTLVDLWPTAIRQVEIASEQLDDRGIVKDQSTWWCFIDWHPDLNKQAAAQAVLLYCAKRALWLANELKMEHAIEYLHHIIARVTEGAMQYLWKSEIGFFVSGEHGQVSYASQIWMVLAGVLDNKANEELLMRLLQKSPEIRPATPYMYHHLVDALFIAGKQELATAKIIDYWGGMVKKGADCFWEVYDPEDERLSPYGDSIINSYCHAWSCTPTYFIREYLAKLP